MDPSESDCNSQSLSAMFRCQRGLCVASSPDHDKAQSVSGR